MNRILLAEKLFLKMGELFVQERVNLLCRGGGHYNEYTDKKLSSVLKRTENYLR